MVEVKGLKGAILLSSIYFMNVVFKIMALVPDG